MPAKVGKGGIDRTAAAIVVALGLVVYFGTLSGGFLNWDDPDYVTGNAELEKPFPEAVATIFGTFNSSNYNPLQRLTYLIEWKLFGKNATAFRTVNLLLHMLAGWLLYLVLKLWLARPGVALATAALFMVHTANVENVAWIAERKTLLATVFAFGAVLAWLRSDGPWARRQWVALLLFTLGLLAKTSIIVLPALLFLLDRSMNRKRKPTAYLPFVVPALVLGIVQVMAASETGSIRSLHGGSLLTHVATIVAVLPRYLLAVVWPFGQSAKHVFEPVMSLGDSRFLLGLGTLMAGTLAVWMSLQGRRVVAVGVAWFVLVLLPTLVVPIPILLADRYLYLAMPFLLAGLADAALSRPGSQRAPALIAFVAWGLVMTFSAARWAQEWKSSLTLWEKTVARSPEDALSWVSLGAARMEARDAEGAGDAYEQALALDSRSGPARRGLAIACLRVGKLVEARMLLEEQVAAEPGDADAWAQLGAVCDLAGDEKGAAMTFKLGLEYCPRGTEILRNLAQFHIRHERPAEAILALEQAVRLDPTDGPSLFLLAELCRRSDRAADASRYEMMARQLK